MTRQAMFITESLFAEKADEKFQMTFKHATFRYSWNNNQSVKSYH